ncbi:MAG: lamin tail domain-containing protein [Methylicorpusculum sp.]|uniref:lamin tail domain-containing protein n=1 Tax=Methylicorpusculum sp. TaxID=2713644 RepID=UPI002728B96F|nr:lamin tail domain-containing protein [Methylicorpusculum sp.]MDO8938292.1 lamin tail domain-containing protein [Methylicorpusculum sp.]MDP2204639.1 lamin tail domain-containing protein [Methylicorpusculum sp.]
MFNLSSLKTALVAVLLLASNQASASGVRVHITEWMYSGNGGEYIEFTNLSGAGVDFTGWSFDDDSRLAGVFDLSGFGIVAHNESVIITEDTADNFREDWRLASTVKVLGGVTNNLGRNDEINLFNKNGNLIDRLAYGDQSFPGSIRTQRISGNPGSIAALGLNDPTLWALSSIGDLFNSYSSEIGDIGNPGQFAVSAVPVPAAVWFFGTALVGLASIKRRRA